MASCSLVGVSNETLDKKLDGLLLHEQFAEKSYYQTVAPSIEDKLVLKKYNNSIKNIGSRYEIGLLLKKKDVTLPK